VDALFLRVGLAAVAIVLLAFLYRIPTADGSMPGRSTNG
jgi:hypothetical protein